MLDEDGFLNLIATRVGPGGSGGDEKTRKKAAKEEADIRKAAAELDARERTAHKEAKAKAKDPAEARRAVVDPASRLWTDRYAPGSLKELCGNKSQADKLLTWLQNW
jgi:replication factor C subunit 1